jgi:NitT/TauT family transport system substrate-binding protein
VRTIARLLTGALILSALIGGSAPSAEASRVVHVGYWGGTCEAPIYIAYEKGIFRRNGLNVELVRLSPATFEVTVASGKVDCYLTTPNGFKSIEQGLDIVITDGVHAGCLAAVVPIKSRIRSVADLRGKTIGTDSLGGGQSLLSMELLRKGIDPQKGVNWRVYPAPQLELALDKGLVDAIYGYDPFPTMIVRERKGRIIFSNTTTKPYADDYCCFIGLTGRVARREPAIARALTKSFAEAADWIVRDPKRAAQIGIDMKYTGGDVDLNTALLRQYHWWHNDPKRARTSLVAFLTGMKKVGMLERTTDINALVKRTFIYMGE